MFRLFYFHCLKLSTVVYCQSNQVRLVEGQNVESSCHLLQLTHYFSLFLFLSLSLSLSLSLFFLSLFLSFFLSFFLSLSLSFSLSFFLSLSLSLSFFLSLSFSLSPTPHTHTQLSCFLNSLRVFYTNGSLLKSHFSEQCGNSQSQLTFSPRDFFPFTSFSPKVWLKGIFRPLHTGL